MLRQGYHIALLRYAAEDEDYYLRYCQRHGLRQEPIMEFSYLLLTSQDSPLARRQVRELDELNDYIEVLHGDTHLPGEESTVSRWEVNPNRRIHVYERCSQFSILQNLPTAYMWSSPMPQRALEQYHLALHNCPAQKQQMRDVLVYPERELCSRRSSCLCSCCTNRRMPPSRQRVEEDLKCAPRLPGCGTQHPHRALGGTRVLLAAAPTTPPCFRRWRRSSLLQRKNYL